MKDRSDDPSHHERTRKRKKKEKKKKRKRNIALNFLLH